MSNPTSSEASRPVTPVAILAAELVTLVGSIGPAIDDDSRRRLERCRDLAANLDPYLERCTSAASETLARLDRDTRAECWGKRHHDGDTVAELESEMLSGHVEGRFLAMLVAMSRARRVIDVGMFTGYSTLAMAEALPEDGEVVALEVDRYAAALAGKHFAGSRAGSRIRIEVGPALVTLERLAAAGQRFDFAFIDAAKNEYADYFKLLLDRGLIPVGGVIAADNTLLQGEPYLPPGRLSENGRAIARFNRVVVDDPRVEQVLVPLRDGVTLIRRIA